MLKGNKKKKKKSVRKNNVIDTNFKHTNIFTKGEFQARKECTITDTYYTSIHIKRHSPIDEHEIHIQGLGDIGKDEKTTKKV